MRKFLAAVGLLAAGLVMGSTALLVASPLSLFTGPAGTNPIQGVPATQPDLNQLIVNLNSAISPTGLFTASTFQVGGSTSVGSLTLGLIQPQGSALSSTTAKEFITFTDSQGNVGYIPVWR